MRSFFGIHAIAALGTFVLLTSCAGNPTQSVLPKNSGAYRALNAEPASCSWSLVSSPVPGIQNNLRGVRGSSGSDMWAVGRYWTSSQGPFTLADHWNGSSWSQVATPNPSPYGNGLNDVIALSSTNAWAVGTQKGASVVSPLIVHWNGTIWKQVAAPPTNGLDTILLSVTGVSPTNIWAVGRVIESSGLIAPYALHYNGKLWKAVTIPNKGTFGSLVVSASMTAGNDVWATGGTLTNASGSTFVTFAEHWNGTKWSIVTTPNANSNNNLFNGSAAISSKDAWAIGDYYNGTTFATLTEHWNGTAWKIVKSPNVKNFGNGLYGATASSSKDVWAVGSTFVGSSQSATLALHWNGTAWAVSSSPNMQGAQDQFNAAAFAPKTTTLWTVGSTLSGGAPLQPLIARKTCAL